MKSTLLISMISLLFSLQAQVDVEFKINHELQGKPFAFDEAAINSKNNIFKLSRMQYYITRFTIIHDGGQEIVVDDSIVFLVDATDTENMYLGNFDVSNIEGVRFHIGVYTPANHEDPNLYPIEHPLGPKSPSMHWGWTAGYRFIVLEGWGSEQLDQKVEIHPVGDQLYYETEVLTGSNSIGGKEVIEVYADYVLALEDIVIKNGLISHGEFSDAAQMCRNFRDYVFSANTLASLEEEDLKKFKVYPSPSAGEFVMTWDKGFSPVLIKVFNQLGQVVIEEATDLQSEFEGSISIPGTYVVSAIDENGKSIQQKIIIQ